MRISFKPTSKFALAVALATGTAVGITGMASPASAQRKKDKEEKAPKQDYSKEFVAAYQPVAEIAAAPDADVAALRAALPGLEAVSSTADDKFALGSLTYSVGQRAQDIDLQFRGVEGMIASGKVPADKVAQFNFQAGQIAFQRKDYARSRDYIERSIALGQRENDPEILIAESYFGEGADAQGLDYLDGIIKAKMDAGEPVSEEWIKRGLSKAYNNDLGDRAQKYAVYYVTQYPSETSWGDAVGIALNQGGYDVPAVLDLLRLARETNTLRTKAQYYEYVESADARKLPLEVQSLIDDGVTAGVLTTSDQYLNEARGTASKRIAEDRTELPALERDARNSDANLGTVVAAGNTFLSYGEYAKAEEFFTKAIAMPGVDRDMALTRLGIAQVNLGKFGEANATLAQVSGKRKPIADLWAAYATVSSANNATS